MVANISIVPEKTTDQSGSNHVNGLTRFDTENRRCVRYKVRDAVLCTVYDHLNDDFEVFEAQLKDKSDCGLLFTTNRQLEIGTPILVRLKHISERGDKDDLKDGIHAQVVRSNLIDDSKNRNIYQVAIEYFESIH